MKITIELNDGSTKVFEGKKADDLASGITTLWDDYVKRELQVTESFEELLRVLRKPE